MKPARVVVDSSVIVKWLSSQDEPHLAQADRLLKDCEAGRITLHAPELAKYDIGNALLKGKGLDLRAVGSARATLYALPIHFLAENESLAERTYALAHRHRITYYDAAFPALAASLRGTLVTDNPKHQGKAKGVRVIPLADYAGPPSATGGEGNQRIGAA